MNFIKRTASAIGRLFRSTDAQTASFPAAVASWFESQDGVLNASGEAINYRSAQTVSTVFTCIRIISESLATLPLRMFEHVSAGEDEEATDHSLHYLLTVQPNPYMGADTLIKCIVTSLGLAGNAYIEIERNDAGQAIALWPLHPRHTRAITVGGQLIYRTSDEPGNLESVAPERVILKEDILHIPLFSLDGIHGSDIITLQRQSIGLAKAAEKQGALWFANNSVPSSGLLINEDDMDDAAAVEFKQSWEEQQGAMRKGRIGVLIGGKWKYESIQLTADQMQFLTTRQFQRAEIAAMFRLTPGQVGSEVRQANSNKVQENLSFVVDCLQPYATAIEIEITRKLLPQTGRKAGKYFVRFDFTERLRADFLTTQQGYALGRQWCYLNGNDIRKDLSLNNGGKALDVFLYPLNMGNAELLLNGDAVAQEQTQQMSLKRAVSHLIPQWRAAFEAASAIDNDDFRSFHSALSPVLKVISDSLNLDTGNENEHLEPVLRSLYRRYEYWPPSHDLEFTDAMGDELSRTLNNLTKALPIKSTK